MYSTITLPLKLYAYLPFYHPIIYSYIYYHFNYIFISLQDGFDLEYNSTKLLSFMVVVPFLFESVHDFHQITAN